MKGSRSKIGLIATMSNFANLRLMSMGGEFFSNHELTRHYSFYRISYIGQAFSLKL